MGNRPDWQDCELVTRHVQGAARFAAQNIERSLLVTLRHLQWYCQSPIEAIYWIWWDCVICSHEFGIGFGPADELEDGFGFSVEDWTLTPQQEVVVDGMTFRVDFEIHPASESLRNVWAKYLMPRIAIEMDGHDFHEKTKEQVTYRNARDRALQRTGWLVLHFSGSEVVRDPERCVIDGLRAAHDLLMQLNDRIAQRESDQQLRQIPNGTNPDDKA
jgi:hypothetical protein